MAKLEREAWTDPRAVFSMSSLLLIHSSSRRDNGREAQEKSCTISLCEENPLSLLSHRKCLSHRRLKAFAQQKNPLLIPALGVMENVVSGRKFAGVLLIIQKCFLISVPKIGFQL